MQSNKRITLIVLILITFIVMLCSTKRVGLLLSPASPVNIEKSISNLNEEPTLSAPSAKLCDISNKSLTMTGLTIADDSTFFILTLFIALLPVFIIGKKEYFFSSPPICHSSIRKHVQLCVFRE